MQTEEVAFIQVFHPIQSVKTTNKAMLCYSRTKSSQRVKIGVAEVCIWLAPSHRQAKHNGKTLELMGSLTLCEDTKEM